MMRSVQFLQKYRVLEGILERRYSERKHSTQSPVIEYMHDDDSLTVRTDLNLMREIRNILSHNSGSDGEPVVEPSEEILERLENIIAHVTRHRKAGSYGTDASRILFADPDDRLLTIIRKMHESGFSQVPILYKGVVCGILSLRSVFDYIAENGLDSIDAGVVVRDLRNYTALNRPNSEQYRFVSQDTDIQTVRSMFHRQSERNQRLSMVLVTANGSPKEHLLRILTPWDVMSDINTKG